MRVLCSWLGEELFHLATALVIYNVLRAGIHGSMRVPDLRFQRVLEVLGKRSPLLTPSQVKLSKQLNWYGELMVGFHRYHRKRKHNFQPSLGVVGSSVSTMLGEGGEPKKSVPGFTHRAGDENPLQPSKEKRCDVSY